MSTRLERTDCCSCGVEFAVPERLLEGRRETVDYTWPPNKPAVGLPEELDGERGGINAYTDDWMAEQRSGSQEGTATGVIGVWGRVIVHEHGLRAQYAYPLALEVLGRPRLQRALERAYGLRMSVDQFAADRAE